VTVEINLENIAKAKAQVERREHRMKTGIVMLMSGTEPNDPALKMAAGFYSVAYAAYAFDVVRGVVEISGTTGNTGKPHDPATVASTKQVTIEAINELRKRLDDYEQFVRTA
jgi:hypothetical protein